MEKSKVDLYLLINREKFSPEMLFSIRAALEKLSDDHWILVSSIAFRDPMSVFIASIFGGKFGIDRFMLGQTGLGVLKLLTCGGIGVWWLVDLFVIQQTTRKSNYDMFFQTIQYLR